MSYEEFRFVKKKEMAYLCGCSSSTLKQYRLSGKLQQGIHWIVVNPRCILYNANLVLDYLQNIDDPKAHQRGVEAYLNSLPSNQPRQRGRKRRKG